jgi:hypothetical protein
MSTYDVVMSLHILAVAVGFATAGVAHSTAFRLRTVRDMRDVRDRLGVLDKVGPFFGASALLIIVFGAWMIQIAPDDEHIGWGDGWILTALVSLVLVEATGGVVIGRGVKRMIHALEGAPDGPVTAETRAVLADRPVWLASHATSAVIVGIVFLMVGKPSGAASVAIVVVAALIGVASAVPFAKAAPAAG